MTIHKNNPSCEELRIVKIDQIRFNPHQPRRFFDEGDLEELAASIKAVGLIQPPVVKPTDHLDQFELISGERRLRACKLAGLVEIPVVIRLSNPSIFAQMALIENIQRVDLNPIEIAQSLKNLMEEFQLSQEEVGVRVGKKRSTIANYLRLLSLPKFIQESLMKGRMSMGHAKAILALESLEKQQELYDLILVNQLSVRETEEAVQKLSCKTKKKSLTDETSDIHFKHLIEKLQQKLGTKVVIQGKGSQGRISIDYFSLDDLDRLLEALGIPKD